MTGATTMTQFTPDAAARLDAYLRQVRSAVAGSPDVSPAEVEADIREHVENEFAGAAGPVGLPELEEVLFRLGPPSQWLPAGRPPSAVTATAFRLRHWLGDRWRAARAAVVRGPEDWRLAYLAFGVFALGVLAFPLFPLFLVVSYFLARAGLAVARERGHDLKAGRKWLLYPPVVIVSTTLLIGLAVWPVAAGAVAFEEVHDARQRVVRYDNPGSTVVWTEWERRAEREYRRDYKERMARQVEEDRQLLAAFPVAQGWAATAAGWFAAAGALTAWWAVLGFVGAAFPRAVRATFTPLCDRFDRRHGALLGTWAGVAFAVWCGFAYRLASDAGLV